MKGNNYDTDPNAWPIIFMFVLVFLGGGVIGVAAGLLWLLLGG